VGIVDSVVEPERTDCAICKLFEEAGVCASEGEMDSVEEDDADEGRGSDVDAVAEEARRESRRRTAEFMEGSRPFLRSEMRYSRNACSERRRGDEGSCGYMLMEIR
jgi:hypothetical protein